METLRTAQHKRVVAVSGGFDPVHIGHVRMFQEARKLGDYLVVILNNDNWIMDKKGAVFMPVEERAEIIRAFSCVDQVFVTDHKRGDLDRSVGKALRVIRPNVFANGGDRKQGSLPSVEEVMCREYDIEMVYGVGGGKIQSSSWLIDKAKQHGQSDTNVN